MGLIKTALKTAVAVKTAHYVHDRIQQRQGEQWAAQQQQVAPVDNTLARLAQLGELRNAGVLSEAEFEAQKARILTG
jgi:membrane protease subunit (stomatin/prohibitin family)